MTVFKNILFFKLTTHGLYNRHDTDKNDFQGKMILGVHIGQKEQNITNQQQDER